MYRYAVPTLESLLPSESGIVKSRPTEKKYPVIQLAQQSERFGTHLRPFGAPPLSQAKEEDRPKWRHTFIKGKKLGSLSRQAGEGGSWVLDPRVRDPRVRDPRLRDPRARDPRVG